MQFYYTSHRRLRNHHNINDFDGIVHKKSGVWSKFVFMFLSFNSNFVGFKVKEMSLLYRAAARRVKMHFIGRQGQATVVQ